jgi:hypothetical protein
MATTTKSTRKKTAKSAKAVKPVKTSKKTAPVAAKTTVITKKTTSNVKTAPVLKDAAVKTIDRTKSIVEGPLDRLRRLHLSTAVLYLIYAGMVMALLETLAEPVTLMLQTRDQFASSNNVVLSPAYEVLYNLEPKWVLAASLLLSGLVSLLVATKLRARYEATLANRTSGMRWIGYGLSGAVLLMFVSLLAGVHDFTTLKLAGGMVVAAAVFGFIAERDNVGAVRTKLLAFWASVLAGMLAFLPLIGSLIGTSLYGGERFSWYVYAMSATLLISALLTGINLYRSLKNNQTPREYPLVERSYLYIDLTTKFLIVLFALLAFKD